MRGGGGGRSLTISVLPGEGVDKSSTPARVIAEINDRTIVLLFERDGGVGNRIGEHLG
jgi:hypothetical protein